MKGVLKKKKLYGDFNRYLDDFDSQFPLKDHKRVDLNTIEGVLEALRIRSVYFIYN